MFWHYLRDKSAAYSLDELHYFVMADNEEAAMEQIREYIRKTYPHSKDDQIAELDVKYLTLVEGVVELSLVY